MARDKVTQRILDLKEQELKLFHSYNRHAEASYKLKILHELTVVITVQEELRKLAE